MLVPVALLLAAIGFLVVALGPGHSILAWVSVGLSAVAAGMILRRWRRSWSQRQDSPEDESGPLESELIADADAGGASPVPESVMTSSAGPAEEDTDATDLLVVYELTDEVLVVDEHPRYHLDRCRWPDRERAERLPVKEARELGFTPCERCRPDKALARKHRSGRRTTTGGG